MTMSRYDVSAPLYAYGDPSRLKRAFWHPGIGMWQLDDAGFASDIAAFQRMKTDTSSMRVANEMADAYCEASGSEAQRRALAWRPWVACGGGGCEARYQEHYCPGTDTVCHVTRNTNVSRLGGVVFRNCRLPAQQPFGCWYIKYQLAQGSKGGWQQQPHLGNYPNPPSPLAFAFYNFNLGSMEHRHWIQADTGYGEGEIYRLRMLGSNSRNPSPATYDNDILCDVTENRGTC
jgi:hypothetical protein